MTHDQTDAEYFDAYAAEHGLEEAIASSYDVGFYPSDDALPDALPILSKGHHEPGSGYACAMDAVSFISGRPGEGDAPSCVHPLLRSQFIRVNDLLPDSERHKLWPLIARAMGTAPDGLSDIERQVLSVRLAVWCARSVSHLVREQDRGVCEAAIAAAEQWAAAPTAANAATAAAAATAITTAAYAAADAATAADAAAYANAAADAAYAAAAAITTAAYADTTDAATAADAAAAITTAAYAAADAADAAELPFLEGLIDEHARLTAHTPAPVDPDRLAQLAETVGVA